MDNRVVIETTVKNMKGLYKDIGEVIQIIEENMENQGLMCIIGVRSTLLTRHLKVW